MKFKAIFIIFNIVVITAFIFISFISPFILMGQEGFLYFFERNFWIVIVFLVFLLIFNIFFFKNWRLYSYLETENWSSLVSYLEEAIFVRRSRRKNFCKILLNAYLVTSNLEGIKKLEKHYSVARPIFINQFSLYFSIPYLLAKNSIEAENFFTELLSRPKLKERLWLRWSLAFSLLQNNKIEKAKAELLELLVYKDNFILQLLTLYLLEPYGEKDPCLKKEIEKILTERRLKIKPEKWPQIWQTARNNILVLILAQIVNDAANWFFKQGETEKITASSNNSSQSS